MEESVSLLFFSSRTMAVLDHPIGMFHAFWCFKCDITSKRNTKEGIFSYRHIFRPKNQRLGKKSAKPPNYIT